MLQSLTFPKSERLHGEIQVNHLFEKGNSFLAYPFRVLWMESDRTPEKASTCVLISVPKKRLKLAVKRNRVKRLVREAYRLNKSMLSVVNVHEDKSLSIGFVWVTSDILPFDLVNKKMQSAISKIVQAYEKSNS